MKSDNSRCQQQRFLHYYTSPVLIQIFGESGNAGFVTRQFAVETAGKAKAVSPLREFIGAEDGEGEKKEIDGAPKETDLQAWSGSFTEPELYPDCQTREQQPEKD